jgi:hypothetical protein
MAYSFRLGDAGNTEIWVEDLYRTLGTVNGKYPGICQHCGKTGIRYIAHVRQDVADTLARGLGNATSAGGPLTLDDTQQTVLSAALLEGKAKKQVDVGCVCVSQYFVDCGVDAGLATRAQRVVNRIMHCLQTIAALEGDSAPERLQSAVARWELVTYLRDRAEAIGSVPYWNEPKLADPVARQMYFAIRSKARSDYAQAAEKWKRLAHGYYTHFRRNTPTPVTVDNLLDYYQRKIAEIQQKLTAYEQGPKFVA